MAINSPYRSSSDLVLQVLTNLGILAVGQPVDTEDFALINNQLDSIFRKIAGLEIVFVSDPSNIPGAWFFDLADIVAGECAAGAGLVGQELSDKINKGLGGSGAVDVGAGAAAKSLKIMARGRPTYEVLRMQNF